MFSFRTLAHRWDPKNQRPELWKLYNGRIQKGESIRVFPLSNWTELNIWQYILAEEIPVVPLYFAKLRPVVERDGCLIMADDERMPLRPGDKLTCVGCGFAPWAVTRLPVGSKAARKPCLNDPRNVGGNNERAPQPNN